MCECAAIRLRLFRSLESEMVVIGCEKTGQSGESPRCEGDILPP